jgi:cell division protein FtsQ
VLGRKRCGATARVARMPGQWKSTWKPWLRWLGVVLALLAGSYAIYRVSQKLLEPERLPLRQVHLQGELRNLSQDELQQLVQKYLGQNFLVLNIAGLQSALASNPWIEQVNVRRQWPDTLRVNFQERTAFGYWGQDEMVDIKGKHFHPLVVRQPGPWPYLAGPEGHEIALMRAYQEANAMLNKVGLRLARLVQDERRAWWISTDKGLEISLGREHFLKRLQLFVDIYPQLLAAQIDKIATVDLRYTNGFAIRWVNPLPIPKSTRVTHVHTGSTPAAARSKTAG